ncbi:MAG TPA: 50S ribosomal protein L10 [Rhodothermales bacterium]|nr:50S ribosomal protein L10 [Rhodothermales bacterium]
MPLTKDQKSEIIDEIAGRLQGSTTVYLTNPIGLTVAQSNELRRRFREADIEFKVLKNTLVRLAMQRLGGYDEIFDQLNGPTGVAFAEEPAAPARVIKKFLDDNNLGRPELKAAYVDGAVYGGSLEELTKLKSRQDILGDIVGLLLSPAANIVGAVTAPGGTLAAALQTISEREG